MYTVYDIKYYSGEGGYDFKVIAPLASEEEAKRLHQEFGYSYTLIGQWSENG